MEQFPYHIWRKLLKEIMINDNSELFQKGNFQGDLELRKAIMYYLRQSRGVHVHASQIVVAAGMENLLFLLRQILGEKVSIGIENPVYKNAYEILKELDFKIHPISMDESGMCVEPVSYTHLDVYKRQPQLLECLNLLLRYYQSLSVSNPWYLIWREMLEHSL